MSHLLLFLIHLLNYIQRKNKSRPRPALLLACLATLVFIVLISLTIVPAYIFFRKFCLVMALLWCILIATALVYFLGHAYSPLYSYEKYLSLKDRLL